MLAQSDWKDKGQSGQRDLRLSYEKITDVFGGAHTNQKPQKLIHLTLDSSERITATEGHPFVVAAADAIPSGGMFLQANLCIALLDIPMGLVWILMNIKTDVLRRN